MIVFQQPWAFVFLPLPLLVTWLMGAYHTPRAALRVSVFQQLVNLTGHRPARGALILKRNVWQQLGVLCSWVAIVAALAQPVWLGEPKVQQLPGRDLMLAVDLSGSMDSQDFVLRSQPPMQRLAGVKRVVMDFVAQRDGDRLGLIVFGNAPYLQVPFTEDHQLFLDLLNEAQTRMAGPKTMLGDAIGLGVNHFRGSDASDTDATKASRSTGRTPKQKVLLLLTDGNDSGSRVPPLDAAKVAADNDIVIHTIAVGDPQAVGEEAMDMDSLKGISAQTGGVFFEAQSGDQLRTVMDELEKLEPQLNDSISYRPQRQLFFWPLGLGLVVQLLVQCGLAGVHVKPGRVPGAATLPGRQ
ncbi:VWA domain-containing protein [Aestuariicella hydrocarbonica]|uniref:VWA domain-containing protein n=1 Tax=Pseudomaricurvus hydrocarbonicus TaxID=1470433 RepID=A0A9E5JTH3_9GAMM|nr:VWA domain-containing protein [Aestuariicella hydrocarbonica]NHO66528.1 VWA domain-containing protein [Aestuariicella hydrocarbonica]